MLVKWAFIEGLETDEGIEKGGRGEEILGDAGGTTGNVVMVREGDEVTEVEVVTEGEVNLPKVGWAGETGEAEMVQLRAGLGMEGVKSSMEGLCGFVSRSCLHETLCAILFCVCTGGAAFC